MRRIIFSDVDGTLLNSGHRISDNTLKAVERIQEDGNIFVIISGRSPLGIYPILRRYGLRCPVITYSGALIQDEDGKVLAHWGIAKEEAEEMISFIGNGHFDLSLSIFSYDEWFVSDRNDPRVMEEERIVEAEAEEGTLDSVSADEVSKLFCICNPSETAAIERELGERFPGFSIVRSDDYLIEIMSKGVSKAKAARWLCGKLGAETGDAVAFGDYYNDEEMLRTVGHGFLMGNAPDPLKERIPLHTDDNDHDGIYKALEEMGII